MRTVMVIVGIAYLVLGWSASSLAQSRYLGQYTINPYASGSLAGPRGATQPSGQFANPYGSGATSPKLYDSHGNFRGNLNANPYDRDSVANPYGRYGSPYSGDSIKNPYGAGSPYRQDSPYNPYGRGLGVYK